MTQEEIKIANARSAKIASLQKIPVEAWEHVAAYWREELEIVLDEQGEGSTPPQRKLELCAQVHMIRIFIDFPTTVKDELAKLNFEDLESED